MGTRYNVIINGSNKNAKKSEIDKLLIDINNSVSTYIASSEISVFNQSPTGAYFEDLAFEKYNFTQKGILDTSYHFHHFMTNLRACYDVYDLTEGLFDPTCMPLVNYWGFGYKKKKPRILDGNKNAIDSILPFVGLDKLTLLPVHRGINVQKAHPAIELDFSAIAKGYAVDLVMEYLIYCGIQNAMVEIGGETKAIGINEKGNIWKIGINTPSEKAGLTDFQEIVVLKNQSIASSGNYRNFYEIDGKKYGHEINPVSGFPEKTDILSVSIKAENCMEADALATGCMIMGLKKSIQIIEAMDGIEGLFIINDEAGQFKTIKTKGF